MKQIKEKSRHKQSISRHTYIKPRLRVIDLVAEEVLGASCRTGSGNVISPPDCVITSCIT